MKESKKKSRPEGQDGSESESCGIDGLLADHFLDDVTDDRELVLLVVVGLEHHKNPNREESQPENRDQEKTEKTYRKVEYRGDHGDKETKDKVENPHGNETYVQRDRLRPVKLHERALVDQKKNQTGHPSKNVAEKAGDIFIDSGSRGIRNWSSDRHSRHTGRRGALSSAALRTK